jgi:hypothetical protein
MHVPSHSLAKTTTRLANTILWNLAASPVNAEPDFNGRAREIA